MSTHGAQAVTRTGAGTTNLGGTNPELERIILYAIIRQDSAAGIVRVASLGAAALPDISVTFALNDPPQVMDFGAQGVLFSQGLAFITNTSADFTLIYERVTRIVA